MNALETIVSSIGPKINRSNVIDIYSVDTTVLYSGPIFNNMNQAQARANSVHKPKNQEFQGTNFDFQAGNKDSPGNLTFKYGNSGLQERIDLSGHDNSQPHINYDVFGHKNTVMNKDNHKVNLFNPPKINIK